MSAGAWGLVAAALLSIHKVEGGKLWGSSPAGNLLIGIGALSAGLLTIYGHLAHTGYAASLMFVGVILNWKARKTRVVVDPFLKKFVMGVSVAVVLALVIWLGIVSSG